MAVHSTLVTNPVTFGPVCLGACHLGRFVLGHTTNVVAQPPASPEVEQVETDGWRRVTTAWNWLTSVGKPLLVGLGLLAITVVC